MFMKTSVSTTKKITCLFLILCLLVIPTSPFVSANGSSDKGTSYPFVFVAGYAGWGQYDNVNKSLPYWGRLNGDLIKYLNLHGFESYASSVDPFGSAWDRACELYAQMTGKVVDYGEVHSKIYKHERFGTDYRKTPLLTGWGTKDKNGELNKVNFIAHSFGGTTVRLISQLLATGAKEEVTGTKTGKVSALFTGGKANWINCITTLASPHNGASSLLVFSPVDLVTSIDAIENTTSLQENGIYQYMKGLGKLMSLSKEKDTGAYDLTVDGAAELNKKLSPLKNIYYFSFPTDATSNLLLSDIRIPNVSVADPLLWPTILLMGSTTTVTDAGTVIDKSWYNNDGVVNTISTFAPKNEAQKIFNAKSIKPGIWNIMEIFQGDHAAIIGGLTYAVDVNALYLAQLKLINSL